MDDKTRKTLFVLKHERQLPAPVDRAVGDDVPAANDFVGAMSETIDIAKRHMVKPNRGRSHLP